MVTTKYKIPEVTNVEVTEIGYDKISIKVTGKDGSNEIKEYEYSIEGGELTSPNVITTSSNTHTFTNLKELQQYTIKVRAIDIQEKKSTTYEAEKVTTIMMPLNIKCQNEEMANCFKDNYYRDESIIYHNLVDATNKGFENYALVADDNSYRYSGASDKVNNYVCFGVDECNEETNYHNLYRIIGIFKNKDTNNYEVKLVKYEYITKNLVDGNDISNFISDYANIWYTNDTKNNYKGKLNVLEEVPYLKINYNGLWEDNDFNKIYLNQFYLGILNGYESMISPHKWIQSGITEEILNNNNIKNAYDFEITENKETTAASKIGLIYVTDYAYATNSNGWNVGLSSYNKNAINNWMYMGLNEWTITKYLSRYENDVIDIFNSGASSYSNGYATPTVRPTFYLNSNVKLASGEGTISNPYRLSLN